MGDKFFKFLFDFFTTRFYFLNAAFGVFPPFPLPVSLFPLRTLRQSSASQKKGRAEKKGKYSSVHHRTGHSIVEWAGRRKGEGGVKIWVMHFNSLSLSLIQYTVPNEEDSILPANRENFDRQIKTPQCSDCLCTAFPPPPSPNLIQAFPEKLFRKENGQNVAKVLFLKI